MRPCARSDEAVQRNAFANIAYVYSMQCAINFERYLAVRRANGYSVSRCVTQTFPLVIFARRLKNPPVTWQAAKAQMAIQFEDRFVLE